MLNVSHFGRSSTKKACVRKLLVLIHDGHLWMRNKIPIGKILIQRITRLPYQGNNPEEVFVGKDQDHTLADNMKNKYELIKGKMGYDINSIDDQAVFFTAHIVDRNIIRKCHTNEVPASMVYLAAQCTNGVQYNQAGYLCKEFLDDCHEVQEKGTSFHYAWLILIIAMLVWKELKDTLCPLVPSIVCEAARYASLWNTTKAS